MFMALLPAPIGLRAEWTQALAVFGWQEKSTVWELRLTDSLRGLSVVLEQKEPLQGLQREMASQGEAASLS